MPHGRAITVRSLLEEPTLGLKVVVAGDLERPVQGAHTSEIAAAAEFLDPDWVMLTTGIRFVGSAESERMQSRLVADLVQRGISALLFGVGIHFDEVPPRLVAAAQAASLTVLTVAREIPFLQIEQFVHRSVMSADAFDLQRRLRIQEDLLDALAGDQPVAALAHRLGALIQGAAVIYEETGRIVASTGEGPTSLIWSAIRAGGEQTTERRFVVGRWFVVTRPVVLRGVGYWLALGSRRERVLDDLAPTILDASQRLLAALRGLRTLSAVQAVAEAEEILRITRSSMTPETTQRVWKRLRAFRFAPENPIRVFVTGAVVDSATGRRAGVPDLLQGPRDTVDEMVELAHTLGLPLVVELREDTGTMSGLIGNQAVLQDWLGEFAPRLWAGLSEPFTDLNLVRARTRDAERALRVAERRARGGGRAAAGAVLFEDVDMVNWLLSSRSVESTAAKASSQLGELVDNSELLETLTLYLSSGLDVQATARSLYLHPNSVRYRLRRISEIVGGPLNSAAVIANLYVALHDRIAGLPDVDPNGTADQ